MSSTYKPYIKQTKIFILVLLGLFFTYFALIKPWNNLGTDFTNYWLDSKLLIDGNDQAKNYDNEWVNLKAKEYGFENIIVLSQFTPITAYVMIPLSNFDVMTAFRIFLLINVIIISINIFLLTKLTDLNFQNTSILVLMSGFCLTNNFAFGQFYNILLMMILSAIHLYQKGFKIPSAILFGVGTSLKYFPIIFIFILLIRKDFKTVLYSFLTIAVLTTVEIMGMSWTGYTEFLAGTFLPHLNGNLTLASTHAVAFQSWNSLLLNLFIYNPDYNPNPVIDNFYIYSAFKYLIYLIIISCTFFYLIKLRKSDLKSNDLYFILISLCALTLLPASGTYHFILLIIPTALFFKNFNYDSNKMETSLFIVCVFIIGFLPINKFVDLHLSGWKIIFCYPRLYSVTALFFIYCLTLQKRIRQTV